MKRQRQWLSRKVADRVKYSGPEPMIPVIDRRGITIHNEGVDRGAFDRRRDVKWLASYVNQKRIPYHAIWNPTTGQWVQMIPFGLAARSLVGGGVYDGVSVNKAGVCNIQICVSGFGDRPFTDLKVLRGVDVLARIAHSWDVPILGRARWGYSATRSKRVWRRDGFHGHCHSPSPGETHHDPANINWRKLKAALEAA